MTTITTQQENTMINSVAASLVREDLCTPKQALATAVVFSANLSNLLNDSEEWLFQVANHLDDVEVDGVKLEVFPALDALIREGYVEFLLDTKVLVAGKRTIKVLDEVKQSYAPLEAINGIVSRVRGYSQVKHSELFKEAIHALESTEYMACTSMLEIAREVYKLANIEQRQELMAEDYVLKGTAKMKPMAAYVSEFFGDRRGRIYQASCFGPNGQSSDMARSQMDLHGVSLDYDVDKTMALLIAEMHDMGSFTDSRGRDYLMDTVTQAIESPAAFILHHMDDTTYVDKPWNFVKFSFLVSALEHGERPYIGVAVGLDAKGSGPQLGALMVADQAMLAATGFTMKQLNDVYHNAIESCEKFGITGLTRSLVKKAFMAVFYGASGGAMMNLNTITHKTHIALFGNMGEYIKISDKKVDFIPDPSMTTEMEEKADLFYTAITTSFGRELNMVRATIKRAGYDYENEVAKFDKPLRHTMPDGFEVAMDYRIKLDIDGNEITGAKPQTTTNIKSGFIDKNFKNMVFTTEEYAYADFARTGFVNMIQATDALLARLIIVHAKRLGAQHIISIHDCFRVNIHDMAILEEAIKLAYKDLFGAMKNKPTKDLPMGTDILGMYFEGSKEATKPEYKESCGHHSQFFKNGTRLLRAINGVRFNDLVDALGTTYYFAK